jgi:hypothetical protein
MTEMIFRKAIPMKGCRICVFCVYAATPSVVDDSSIKSVYGKNIVKVKDFLNMTRNMEKAHQMTSDQRVNFRKTCLVGNTMIFNVFKEAGNEDIIIAAAQFKRTVHGTWINLFCRYFQISKEGCLWGKGRFFTRRYLILRNWSGI